MCSNIDTGFIGIPQAFINDAVKTAHAQKLTGFNFDLETAGMSANLTTFLQKFTVAMHAAREKKKISLLTQNVLEDTGRVLQPPLDEGRSTPIRVLSGS